MILLFNLGGTQLLYGVGKNRELSVAAPINNYTFVTIDKLNRYKKLSDVENKALIETQRIVKSLSTLDEVKKYIINENNKLGGTFIRVLKPKEYLRMFQNEFNK